ncbi:hypothetical protein D3C76_1862320 [compost metagenome]
MYQPDLLLYDLFHSDQQDRGRDHEQPAAGRAVSGEQPDEFEPYLSAASLC